MRRRRRHKNARKPAVENAGAVGLIPAGPVPEAQAGRVEVETVAIGKNNNALMTRYAVSTPVRRLLQSGCISMSEVGAAQRFRDDYACAYLTSTNPLDCVLASGDLGSRSGSIHGAMLYKASAGTRYREAEIALGPHAARILRAIVLEDRDCGVEASFAALGAELSPNSSPRSQRDAARGASILALQQLADIYENYERRKGRLRSVANKLTRASLRM